MSGIRALSFIAAASLRNMLMRQLRRLRRPRYLLATLMGFIYLWGIFARHGAARAPQHLGLEATFLEALLLALALGIVLWTWAFGGDEAAIRFSEAEIQFLFPAPLTRRQLVTYKLTRTLLFSGFTALLLTLGLGQRLGVPWPRFLAAAWMGVATLGLHNIAASLTRGSLLQRGTAAPVRRAAALVIPAFILGSAAWTFWRAPPAPRSEAGLQAWFELLLRHGPLRWAGLPFRPAIELALGRQASALALAGSLTSLGIHYAWALSTGADFQEGALAAAERRGRRLDQRRRGQLPNRHARAPWRLAPTGSPVVALFWKNLTAAVRLLSLRLVVVFSLTAALVLAPVVFAGGEERRILAAGGLTLLAAYFTFFGTQILRVDFRLDLPNMDLLRTLPLRGWQVAAGEVLAPVVVLAGAQWVCLALAAAVVPTSTLAWASRLSVAVALALLVPPLDLALSVVQNAAALVFPAWVSAGVEGPRGVEAMGQRLLTLAGTLLVLAAGLVPAAVAGVAAIALVGLLAGFGPLALVLGAAAAAAVLTVEGAFGVLWLGRLFDHFDLGST